MPPVLLGLKSRTRTTIQTMSQQIHVIVGCAACHSSMRLCIAIE
ncbi:hypothetical protein [Enhydrobacter sp.]|nr:hypothetical protein [Enhydrobacter sp.]